MSEEQYVELEGKIIDLQFDLKKCKDRELIFLEIISTIDLSLKDLFNREEENLRFNIE